LLIEEEWPVVLAMLCFHLAFFFPQTFVFYADTETNLSKA
jgi:hypothetical protein